MKGIDVVKTGIGMPAFVGDKSYIAFIRQRGVPIEEARNYSLAGCIDPNLPGNSRVSAIFMFIVPMVLEIALHNGIFPKTGERLGPETGDPAGFKTFDELFNAFKTQFAYFLGA
jgi:formate C-acetyltransferase